MIALILLVIGLASAQVPLDRPAPAVPVEPAPAQTTATDAAAAPSSDQATDEGTGDTRDTGDISDISDISDTGEVHARVNDEGLYEVTVYGADAIREARKKLEKAIEAQGWRSVGSRDGSLLFRGAAPWMGKAVLDREGYITFTTPAVVFRGAQAQGPGVANQGANDQGALAQESPGGDYQGTSRDPGSGAGVGASFTLFPSKKKTRPAQDSLLTAVQPQLDAYRKAIQATAFQQQLSDLPDHLDALWQKGTPFDPSVPPLETFAQRRAAVLDYWATRADTPEGRDVCRRVETWLEEEVMSSEHPVTPEEQAAANDKAKETHGRTLRLVRP